MTFLSRFCFANLIVVFLSQWKLGFSREIYLNAARGNVTSPKYPNGYKNSAEWIWKITVPSGNRIRLTIKDVNFAEKCNVRCDCDAVEVFDGFYSSSRTRPLVEFCSSVTNPPRIYTSTGNKMEVAFFTGYKQNAGRGLWFYYETIYNGGQTTPVITTPPNTIPITELITGEGETSSSSSKLSTVERSILVIAIISTVVLSVLVIFCCSIKKRISRIIRRRRAPATASRHPCPDQTIEIPEELTFEELRNAPPSYEEAVTSSRLTLNTQPPPYSIEPNENNNSTPVTSSQPNINSTEEAYDSTGLPSYAEAHRLSQSSINAV